MKRCCFFGHARYPYEGCRATIKSIVKDLIEHHGVTVFYSGGRGDFDSMCARIVQCHLDKKKIHLEQMCRNAYLFFFM